MTAPSRPIALVTGAANGTGVDIARALARAGARVAVHDRSDRAADEDVDHVDPLEPHLEIVSPPRATKRVGDQQIIECVDRRSPR